MAEETKSPREIEFFFEYEKDYRVIGVNGAWIGNTTRGDITIDFFVERLGVPESVRNAITEDGRLGDQIEPKRERKFTRRLQIGVLLSVENAELLVEFLKRKVDDLKKMKESK